MAKNSTGTGAVLSGWTTRIFPFLEFAKDYDRATLRRDLIAGLTVALVLVPQSMAYAQLAGLPAYYGLYAALLPPVVAALFGCSRQLHTGPVAMVSLMTAAALEPLAHAGGEGFIAYAILLSLLVGVCQFLMGVLRLGALVGLVSHPVIIGFTNAGALIIATSQLPKMFGVAVPPGEHHYETVYNVLRAAFSDTHLPTLLFGATALAAMIIIGRLSKKLPAVLIVASVATVVAWAVNFEDNHTVSAAAILQREPVAKLRAYNALLNKKTETETAGLRLGKEIALAEKRHGANALKVLKLRHELSLKHHELRNLKKEAARRRAELRALKFVRVRTAGDDFEFIPRGADSAAPRDDDKVWHLKVPAGPLGESKLVMIGGGAVVGHIPSGLPAFSLPGKGLDPWTLGGLIEPALIISLVGFLEAISVAKAVAAQTGQRLRPNQELIGQGLSNIAGSFFQSYPVSGSFSRTAVNFQAGAVTGFAGVFASLVVLVFLLFLTPTLYYLPQAVLAAIIIRAALGLFRPRTFATLWRVHRGCGVVAVTTFAATLYFAPHLDFGIFVGVAMSLGFWIRRQMRPHTAVLAKYTDGSYRDSAKRGLKRCRHILAFRFNGALFFANAVHLEEQLLTEISTMPDLRHVLIVCNGINDMDAAGEEVAFSLFRRLREARREVYLSGLNDAVLGMMEKAGLYKLVKEENLFRNVAAAVKEIRARAHAVGETLCPVGECPLTTVICDEGPAAPPYRRRPETGREEQRSGAGKKS